MDVLIAGDSTTGGMNGIGLTALGDSSKIALHLFSPWYSRSSLARWTCAFNTIKMSIGSKDWAGMGRQTVSVRGSTDLSSLLPSSTWNAVSSLMLPQAHCSSVKTGNHDPWCGLYKRPVGLTAVKTLTSPYLMGFTVARNMSLACLSLAHKHIVLLTEEEEKAIETNTEPEYVPFPWDDLPEALKRGALNSCMEVTVLSIRGGIDWITGEIWMGKKTDIVVRMRTDMRRTSRALAPAYPLSQRFARVVKTALWSEISLYVSEWFVTSLLDTFRLIMAGKDRLFARIMIKMGMHGARCATLWLAVSAGNGVGASSPKLQPLCMLIGANAAALLVNSYYARLTRNIENSTFNGSDGSGDAGDSKPGDGRGTDPASKNVKEKFVSSIELGDTDTAGNTFPSSQTSAPSLGPRLPPRKRKPQDEHRDEI
jgi:hypothetical protein